MRKYAYCMGLFVLLMLSSCEEVINVDLEAAAPRLVIDAGIDWIKGTDGQHQVVRLTTTAPYFDAEIPTVSGAAVYIVDGAGSLFEFAEDPGTGNYICDAFVPVLGQQYTLHVVTGGQEYTATETLNAVPEISRVEQNDEGGFLGDETEVRFFFPDDAAVANYYYLKTESPVLAFPELDTFSDEFFNGNESFGFFSNEDLEPGQTVRFTFHAVSRRYQEYISRILQNTGSGAGPFGTAAATVRGNIVNAAGGTDYALGYFRVSQAEILDYTVE